MSHSLREFDQYVADRARAAREDDGRDEARPDAGKDSGKDSGPGSY